MRSLRRTLAVRFCITVFFALLLIALWAHLGARRILLRELDRGLAAASELEADVLAAGHQIPRHVESPDLPVFVRTVNRFVVVRAPDGTMLASNTALAHDLPFDEEGLRRAQQGERVWVSQTWNGIKIRSIYAPRGHGSASGSIIQVSASLAPIRTANREILFLMLGTVLLGTVATTIGAAWLAGSAMLPVFEIAEQAENIKAGTVGQRITVHGDVAELQGLTTVLNSMLARLDQVVASQRRMISDAGHDLRTPITAMRGEIEVALRGERTPATYKEILASVMEEVQRLESISESLVLLARIDSGALAPNRIATPLQPLLEQAVHRAEPRANGRRISLREQEGEPTADVDEHMFALVLDHLLDNSLRHTPDGTTVSLGAFKRKHHVDITIEDDGPGIPEDRLPHLFERFYRDDSARTRTAGAGLGLSIAWAIVQAHDGTIEARLGQQGGLLITISLPHHES